VLTRPAIEVIRDDLWPNSGFTTARSKLMLDQCHIMLQQLRRVDSRFVQCWSYHDMSHDVDRMHHTPALRALKGLLGVDVLPALFRIFRVPSFSRFQQSAALLGEAPADVRLDAYHLQACINEVEKRAGCTAEPHRYKAWLGLYEDGARGAFNDGLRAVLRANVPVGRAKGATPLWAMRHSSLLLHPNVLGHIHRAIGLEQTAVLYQHLLNVSKMEIRARMFPIVKRLKPPASGGIQLSAMMDGVAERVRRASAANETAERYRHHWSH